MGSNFKAITKPEWEYKSDTGDYQFSISLLEKDVLLARTIGFAHKKDVNNAEQIILKVLAEFFPFDVPFYLISDFTEVTGASTRGRNEHLNHRLKQINRISLLVYSNPNNLLKIIINTGRLFSPQLREKIIVSKNLEHALSIIKQHKEKSTKTPIESVNPTNQLADSLTNSDIPDDKQALKKLVIKLRNESAEQKKDIELKTERFIKTIGGIAWGEADKTTPFEIDENDDFSDLFTSFNLLQTDLAKLITSQKKYHEELIKNEKQYKILFNNIADIVMLHDMKTHYFVDFNDKALQYGYTKNELLSMTPFDLHSPEEHKKVAEHIDEKNETPGTGNRYKHIMKDGTQIDVEILTSEIEYNGRPTWISIIRDITDRKRFENAIIEQKKEAEAASRAKSEFLANMSHEIRTPMNGVIGMLDLLSETELTEEQYEFAISAQQSADSLLMLINDILDFSKIEAGKLEIEIIDFNLTVTLDSISDLLSIKAYEKGINFDCLIEKDVPLLLKGDPSRLRQILLNLAGNALKFTTKGGILIKVSLNKETKTEASLLFEVIDTGTGISKNKLDVLFDSFTQADTSITRKYGGTGLGLAISKQLTELMDGKIAVTSEFGKGSNFHFSITFKKQVNGKQSLLLADDIKGTKILIVDDNSTNHKIFKEYLKSWGCEFDKANCGNDALLLLNKAVQKRKPYKVALIDMQIPYMKGEELGRAIKEQEDIKNTILIMLSPAADRGDVERIKNIGFSGFLTKPIKKTKLFDTLRAVLSVDSQENISSEKPIITSYKVEEIKKAQIGNKKRLKILIAEDNRINQLVAKKMIQHITQNTTIANNGREAVDLFVKENFDVIFMDIQMPVMDGEEAIKKIRDLEKASTGHIPIIALTANAMKGDRERFLACGADGYLPKPIKKEALITAMDTLGLI